MTPSTAQVILGNSSQFAAAVQGISNSAVTWQLSGAGTVSSSGIYTAPADLPSSTSATITATSQANSTVSGSAQVTITSDIVVSIQTNPAQTSSVVLGSTLSLTNSITSAGKPDTSVTWNVNGIKGGNSTVGTITGTGPYTYTAPSAMPDSAQISIQAVSVADPSKTASLSLTLTSPSVTVSNSSPISLTPLQIKTSVFTPTTNTVVTFSDGQSFTFAEKPIRIASDGTVFAAVPLYVDSSGAMASGTLSMTLIQGSVTTPPVKLNVQELPTVASYGAQPGAISQALFVYQALVAAQSLNALQAVAGSSQNTVSTSATISSLKTALSSALAAKADIDKIVANPNLSITEATLSDGTTFTLNAATLDQMDRVIGVLLSGQFGSIITSATAATASSARLTGVGANAKSRLVLPKTSAGAMAFRSMSSLTSSQMLSTRVAHARGRKRNLIAQASAASALTVWQQMQLGYVTATAADGTVKAVNTAEQYLNPPSGSTAPTTTETILDEVSAIAGGLQAGVTGALGTVIDSKLADQFGSYVGVVASTNTIVQCLTDSAIYFTFVATGQDTAASLVVQDLDSIKAADIGSAVISLLSIFTPSSIPVTVASDVYTFTTTALTYLNNDFDSSSQTTQSVVDEGSTINTSNTDGIGLLEGSVSTASTQDDTSAQVEINPAPGGQVLDAVTDADGDFEMLVPVGQPGFDYEDVTLTASDSSGNVIGSQTDDLVGFQVYTPITLAPVNACGTPGGGTFTGTYTAGGSGTDPSSSEYVTYTDKGTFTGTYDPNSCSITSIVVSSTIPSISNLNFDAAVDQGKVSDSSNIEVDFGDGMGDGFSCFTSDGNLVSVSNAKNAGDPVWNFIGQGTCKVTVN